MIEALLSLTNFLKCPSRNLCHIHVQHQRSALCMCRCARQGLAAANASLISVGLSDFKNLDFRSSIEGNTLIRSQNSPLSDDYLHFIHSPVSEIFCILIEPLFRNSMRSNANPVCSNLNLLAFMTSNFHLAL